MVADNTKPSLPLQAAASLSHTYSMLWIEALIAFIDETYSELTRAKFSEKQGWSLIIRLSSRILIEVAAPRSGVKQNFITGRIDVISKQIFWAVIRSHDIMARYKDKSFKNDPLVSAEYVKFLIMNTWMELIDQLVKRVTTLEDRVNLMAKDLKSADTKVQTTSNNVSTALKAI
jgi:hypothetical protein